MELGTAKITQKAKATWTIDYCNVGSFLQCEWTVASEQEALRFCRERRLQVTAVNLLPATRKPTEQEQHEANANHARRLRNEHFTG